MIGSLALTNLKCFEELSLDLAPLTVLTGFNAAGKSTRSLSEKHFALAGELVPGDLI